MNRINETSDIPMTIEQIDRAIANARYQRSVAFWSLFGGFWQKISNTAVSHTEQQELPDSEPLGLTKTALKQNLSAGQTLGRWINGLSANSVAATK